MRAAGELPLVRGRAGRRTSTSRSRCPRSGPGTSARACRRPAASWSSSPRTLEAHDPDNPERPVLNRYIPSWEGPRTAGRCRPLPAADDRHPFALQLPHATSTARAAPSTTSTDHRVRIGGHYLLAAADERPGCRASAASRHRDLVKVWNDRGAVICAADVSPMVARGVGQVLRIERRVPARSRSTASGSRLAAA